LSGAARLSISVEITQLGSVYYLPYRQVQDGLSSSSVLVPAGCRFRVLLEPITPFNTSLDIKSRKFGRD